MFQKFLGSDEIWCFLHFFGEGQISLSTPKCWCPLSPAWLGEVLEQAGENQKQDPIPSKQPDPIKATPILLFFFPQKLFQKQQEIAEHPHPMHRALPWWDAAHSSLLPGWDMRAANAAQNAAYIRIQGVRQQVYGTICEKSSLQ